MKKHLLDLTVVSNIKLNPKHYLIKFTSTEPLPEMQPGQFVEVKIEGSDTTYLRRPFSIHRVNKEENTMHLLVKVIGDGTNAMSLLKPGDVTNIMMPLGKGFILTQNNHVLLVGGGCGVAPLYYLAQQLVKEGNVVQFLIGGRTAEDILMADEYLKFGDLFITTEDGSLGEKGMVTGHSILKSDSKIKIDKIYCCGPDGMMRAMAHYAESKLIPCEVSLENTMACGIGACLCCVVESTHGNICVCTEGPVFNSKILKGWTNEEEVGCSLDA